MKEEKESENNKNESAFNGSLNTLERIHELIQHISAYMVNGHLLGVKENLGELLIESQGFLTKVEYKKAWIDWEKINKIKLTITDDGNIIFEEELKDKLFKFSAWLRLKLHRHKVTIAPKAELIDGLTNVYSKYKI